MRFRALADRFGVRPRATAPPDPMPAELWADETSGRLKRWVGGAWRVVAEVGDAVAAHSHSAADIESGVLEVARLPVHAHSANDVVDGVLALARLPVAPSGNANPTQVPRADDARLSDPRTPLAHSHAMSDLPAAAAALAAYPVGAVYIAVVNTSPATLFGGTWASLGVGRTIMGVDPGQAEFATVEQTGGAKSVTLTAAQSGLPGHGHGVNDPGHSHGLQNGGAPVANGGGAAANITTGGGGYVLSGIASSGTGISVQAAAAQNASAAHENLPPYVTVYMWKRTA